MRRIAQKIKTESQPWGQFNNDPQVEKSGETAHDRAEPDASPKMASDNEKTSQSSIIHGRPDRQTGIGEALGNQGRT
jgi:hypothetical protein